MANEITLTQRLQLSNGALLDDNNPGRIQITQTTQTIYKAVVSIGTTEESVTFAELTTPGICYLKNLDGTNYVQWGVATTVYSGRLKASCADRSGSRCGARVLLAVRTRSAIRRKGVRPPTRITFGCTMSTASAARNSRKR